MAKIEDHDKIVDFEYNYFFKECHLTKLVSDSLEDPKLFSYSENKARKTLKNNMTIVAKDPTRGDQIIGVAGCGIYQQTCQREKFPETTEGRKIVDEWLSYANNSINIVQELKTNKILKFERCSIHPEYLNQGLYGELRLRTLLLGRLLGYEAAFCIVANTYAGKALAKLGLETLFRMSFAEYTDENGVKVFENVEHPHTHFSIMGLKLNAIDFTKWNE